MDINIFCKFLISISLLPFTFLTADLGPGLTPMGAESSANADGSIPAWTGGLTQPPPEYVSGKWLVDPYRAESPLFTISADSISTYADKLTPGLTEMLRRYPDSFRLRVFPTHRNQARPQFVYDALQHNATGSKLTPKGLGFTGAQTGSPFPIPKNGSEVLWNYLAQWRPDSVVRFSQGEPLSSGRMALGVRERMVTSDYFRPGGSAESAKGELFRAVEEVHGPATANGEIYLVIDPIDFGDRNRSAWRYVPWKPSLFNAPGMPITYGNTLQRPQTVASLPAPVGDTPIGDGTAWLDLVSGFNGSPEEYDWQLLGKREMYVPYNNYSLNNGTHSDDEIVRAGHFASDLVRYELHRVWVVEGHLKAGEEHISPLRRLYFDEDSWVVLLAENYDRDGKLWKVYQNFEPYDYSCLCIEPMLQTVHDLSTGRYFFSGLLNDQRPRAYPDDLNRSSFTPTGMRMRASN